MLFIVSDGGIRKIPTSSEKAGAYSVSLTKSNGNTYRSTHIYKSTTISQMEMMGLLLGAAEAALHIAEHGPETVYLVSDSQLVIKTIMDGGWLEKWKANGFRKRTTGRLVSNHEIWMVMDEVLTFLRSIAQVKTYWIRGHLSEEQIRNMTDPLLKVFSRLNKRCDEALGEELEKTHFSEDRYRTIPEELARIQSMLQKAKMMIHRQ